jgi:hypothetical protein
MFQFPLPRLHCPNAVFLLTSLPSVCSRPGVEPPCHDLQWSWWWAGAQSVPGHLHGIVSLQLACIGVDWECPLEDSDSLPEGDGCGKGDASVLDGEGAGDVNELLEGLNGWQGDMGKDGGPWLVLDKLSVQAIEEGVAHVLDGGLLNAGGVDGVGGAGVEEVSMSLVVATDLVGEDEGAFNQEGDAVVEVVVEVVILPGVGRPVLWGGVGGDAGGAGVGLGAASGDVSTHSWVWGTPGGSASIVAGGGSVLRHCGCFIGCNVGGSKVLVFGHSRSHHYISGSPLPQALGVMGFAVPPWLVWLGVA